MWMKIYCTFGDNNQLEDTYTIMNHASEINLCVPRKYLCYNC